jgi:hypothetical protein
VAAARWGRPDVVSGYLKLMQNLCIETQDPSVAPTAGFYCAAIDACNPASGTHIIREGIQSPYRVFHSTVGYNARGPKLDFRNLAVFTHRDREKAHDDPFVSPAMAKAMVHLHLGPDSNEGPTIHRKTQFIAGAKGSKVRQAVEEALRECGWDPVPDPRSPMILIDRQALDGVRAPQPQRHAASGTKGKPR